MDERYDDDSYTIIVPVLNDDLSLITFVVPTEFKMDLNHILMMKIIIMMGFTDHRI